MERSPIKYLSSLDPTLIVSSETLAMNRMEKLLCQLYEKDWISSIIADKAKTQLIELITRSKSVWKNNFAKYDSSKRLDHF